MYFPYFAAYIIIGLSISLVLFCWAVRTGQFQDQQRARYLPLRDEGPRAVPARLTFFRQLEIYGLFFLAVAGLAASAALVIYALYFS
jgi:cbb3-type cytochrome oxidase maturation protein